MTSEKDNRIEEKQRPALPVFSPAGEKVGEVEVLAEVFAAPVKPKALHAAAVGYLANRRQGNASTKTRGEMAGSTRKLFRQKGTGRARMGSRRSPVRVGGGAVFGPLPRDYRQRLPERMRRQALLGALSSRAAAGEIRVLESLSLPEISTKAVAVLLKSLGAEERVLLVADEPDEILRKSTRNIAGLTLARAADLNAYELLRHRHVLFTKAGLSRLQEALS